MNSASAEPVITRTHAGYWKKKSYPLECTLHGVVNACIPMLLMSVQSRLLERPELQTMALQTVGPGAFVGGAVAAAFWVGMGRGSLIPAPPPLLPWVRRIALPVGLGGWILGIVLTALGVGFPGGAFTFGVSVFIGAAITCIVYKVQVSKEIMNDK